MERPNLTCAKTDVVLLLAFLFSGFAALGYELLWTRLLSLVLGSESLAVLGVLAGFFGGMVFGACYFNRPIRRAQRPLHFFVLFETIAAVYALASPHLLYWLQDVLPSSIGPIAGNNDNIVALLISTVTAGCVLLPATVCMGGTLVALVETRRRYYRQDAGGRGLGRLYAANTVGAALGVSSSVYLILPNTGLLLGSVCLSLVGLGSALLALVWRRVAGADAVGADNRVNGGDTPGRAGVKNVSDTERACRAKENVAAARCETRDSSGLFYVLIFGTGLAGIGLEVVTVLIMSLLLQNTVYTFANILTVYLVGTAAGAWLYQHFLKHKSYDRSDNLTVGLLLSLALAVVLVAILVRGGPSILEFLAPSGAKYARHLMSEITFAGIVFAVPTILMGALFSHLVGTFVPKGIGKAYGLNMLGAALAPFVFGLAAIRLVGLLPSLYMVMSFYLLLYLTWVLSRRVRVRWALIGLLCALPAWALAPSELGLIRPSEGWKLNERREGLMGAVIVTERIEGVGPWGHPLRLLQVNRHFRMGGGASFAEKRMGHLALLLAPNANETLFLGVGTATTLGAVRQYPVEHVDAVEIVPEILDVLPWFDEINDGVRNDPRVSFYPADARRYVAASKKHYDLIVGDLFHPGRDGAGSLYSLEHFEGLSRHLSKRGIVAQWIPLYQFDVENLKIVIRTFLAAFRDVHSFIGTYNANAPILLLVGKNPESEADGIRVDISHLKSHIRPDSPAGQVILGERDLLASYFLDREALVKYARGAPVNSDMNPVVLFKVPKSSYEHGHELSYGSLSSLMPYRRLFPWELISGPDSVRARLTEETRRTSEAVGHYLDAEISLAKSESRGVTLEVLKKYLAAYRADPEFAPARGRLMAEASENRDSARFIYPYLNGRDRTRIDQQTGVSEESDTLQR